MDRAVREIVISWVFAFAAGAVLWPPGAVYWEAVAAVIGDLLTLGIVAVVAAGIGAAFVRRTGIRLQSFVGGALAAYGSGMLAVELVSTPESPVHLVWYAGLLGCFVGGAFLSGLADEGDSVGPVAGN